jgi:hypothetical protein
MKLSSEEPDDPAEKRRRSAWCSDEAAWDVGVERRIRQIDAGEVECVPWETVMAELRAHFSRCGFLSTRRPSASSMLPSPLSQPPPNTHIHAESCTGLLARLLIRSEHHGLALLRQRALGMASAAQPRKFPTRLLPCTLMGRSEGEVIHGIALLQPSRAPCCWHARW